MSSPELKTPDVPDMQKAIAAIMTEQIETRAMLHVVFDLIKSIIISSGTPEHLVEERCLKLFEDYRELYKSQSLELLGDLNLHRDSDTSEVE